jgi:hypothetical protein
LADVFVSYKREDERAVARLVKAMRGDGLTVWWDRDIPTGAPWEETIEREHGLARCLVVCWSKAAVASENVKAEARKARSKNQLVQTFIEPCEPPMFFGERQGVDLSGWTGRADDPRVKAVIAGVRATLEGRNAEAGVGTAAPGKSPPLPMLLGGALTVLALIATVAWFATRPTRDSAPEPTAEDITLAGIEGRWGTPTCSDSIYTYSVVRDAPAQEIRVVAAGSGSRSEGRVMTVRDGVITTEALTPEEDRGNVVELRPEPTQLVIQDRRTDTRLVMAKCP